MRYLMMGAILAAIFGSAAIVAVLMGREGAAWRVEFAERQAASRAERAERAARAEADRRAEELAEAPDAQTPARPASPAYASSYNPLGPPSRGGGQGSAATAYDGPVREDLGDLPDTAGVETVYYSCTACHGLPLVTQQRVTRERWDRLLTWMTEEQNMPELGDDREAVLDYLARHFGPG